MKLNLSNGNTGLSMALIARALVGQRVRLLSDRWEQGYCDGTLDSFHMGDLAFYFRPWYDADEELAPLYKVPLHEAYRFEVIDPE